MMDVSFIRSVMPSWDFQMDVIIIRQLGEPEIISLLYIPSFQVTYVLFKVKDVILLKL